MVKILLVGALGKMGAKIRETVEKTDGAQIICGVDRKDESLSFPVYSSFDKVSESPDVIIDFSSADNLSAVLGFAESRSVPAVLCATGYSPADETKIKTASDKIAIFRSANMSLGVNLLISLVKKAEETLKNFDVEIIEKHHNMKADAPSGTALMLANAVKEVSPEKFFVYGREGEVGARNRDEIGIHAVRGGNIVGEHEVLFAGESETVTLSHSATDRSVFARGAVQASIYLSSKKSGLFDMNDLINGK